MTPRRKPRSAPRPPRGSTQTLQVLARPDQTAERRNRGRRQGLAEEESRSRLGLPALAEGIWRARCHADRARDLATGRRCLRQTDAAVPDWRGHVRADRDGLWQRGAQTPLSAEARLRRTNLVPIVFGAGGRIRRRRLANARGETRR